MHDNATDNRNKTPHLLNEQLILLDYTLSKYINN